MLHDMDKVLIKKVAETKINAIFSMILSPVMDIYSLYGDG